MLYVVLGCGLIGAAVAANLAHVSAPTRDEAWELVGPTVSASRALSSARRQWPGRDRGRPILSTA